MTSNSEPTIIPLWPNGAPGSEDWTHQEQETRDWPPFNITIVRNVAQPNLTVFLPDPSIATGTAVVVCPGGAFHLLAIDHEGYDVARWLNERGVAAFVLRYRVVPTDADDQLFAKQIRENMSDRARMQELMQQFGALGIADGQQAVRLVRARADEWGIAQDQIGIMGFSAGGVVTIGAMTQYDADNRPAFAAPIYPPPWELGGVPNDAPPIFIAVANDDAFAISGCIPVHTAWTTAGKSSELHIYAEGGHGFGMRTQHLPVDSWIERFGDWLNALGLLTRNSL